MSKLCKKKCHPPKDDSPSKYMRRPNSQWFIAANSTYLADNVKTTSKLEH